MRVHGLDMHVVDEGQGEVLLLVHGFPLDHSMWRHQIEAFSASHRVLAPDLRGFGRSAGPGGDVVSMQQFADDMAGLLEALGIREPVTFCGLSMGGYIGWQFWERHRDRLARLVLCDTRSAADSPEAAQMRLQTAARVLQEGTAFLADSMLEKLFAPCTREEHPDVVRRVREVILATSPAAIAAALRGMATREDFTDRLSRVDVPTLVLCGEHDVISPLEEMRTIAEAIPGAVLVPIDGAGHMAPLEQPDSVNHALRTFLDAPL